MAEEIRLTGELGEAAVYGADNFQWPDDPDNWDQEAADKFLEEFEFLGERFLGDPKEDYYQGLNFTTAWKRKSDGKVFGFTYWEDISKYGEKYIVPTEEENDDWGTDYVPVYVFKEVTPFTVQGYAVGK